MRLLFFLSGRARNGDALYRHPETEPASNFASRVGHFILPFTQVPADTYELLGLLYGEMGLMGAAKTALDRAVNLACRAAIGTK